MRFRAFSHQDLREILENRTAVSINGTMDLFGLSAIPEDIWLASAESGLQTPPLNEPKDYALIMSVTDTRDPRDRWCAFSLAVYSRGGTIVFHRVLKEVRADIRF